MYEENDESVSKKLENIWGKVTKGVEEGIKVGKVEIVRTAKVGKIRLEISSLKSSKNDKLQLMGTRVYALLKSGQITIPQLDDLMDELKCIELEIEKKEKDIKQVLDEKKPKEETEETDNLDLGKEIEDEDFLNTENPVEKETKPEREPLFEDNFFDDDIIDG